MQAQDKARVMEMEANTFFAASYLPYTTTDDYAEVLTLDVCGYVAKTLVVKNTGAQSITYRVTGSMDDGTEYDVSIVSPTPVLTGASSTTSIPNLLTHLKIEAKSSAPATPSTVVLKLAMFSGRVA